MFFEHYYIRCWCLHFSHKIHKGLCFILCEHMGLVVSLYNPPSCRWSHKCCITLAFYRSLRTSIVSLSLKRYFKIFFETFFQCAWHPKCFVWVTPTKAPPYIIKFIGWTLFWMHGSLKNKPTNYQLLQQIPMSFLLPLPD
jgi:hypothetical protein